MKVLVLGSGGQLGKCLMSLMSEVNLQNDYAFYSHDMADVTNIQELSDIFLYENPDIVINCTAYTNVNEAENNKKDAFDVNFRGVLNLSHLCENKNIILIHISTDYVFDGKKNTPYTEEDATNPLNIYGLSKLTGEEVALWNSQTIIIRTSWLFSEYDGNFLSKIMDSYVNGENKSVVKDQTGSPTYARDLASSIIFMMEEKRIPPYGIYHFCNNGCASWYDLANSIFEQCIKESYKGTDFLLEPCHTSDFPYVERPSYSVLDNDKFRNTFYNDCKIRHWSEAVRECVKTRIDKKIQEGNEKYKEIFGE